MSYNERLKRQAETRAERCARIEKQVRHATEEAERKYGESLQGQTKPMTRAEWLEQKIFKAQQEADAKYAKIKQEQFYHTMHTAGIEEPVVENSNKILSTYNIKVGKNIDLAVALEQKSKEREVKVNNQRMYSAEHMRKLAVLKQHIITLDAISSRPELLGILTIRFNIQTIGDLISIPVKAIAQLCRLNNVEFTDATYVAIRVELQNKYKLVWKKPSQSIEGV